MQKPPLSVRENPEARERYYAYDEAIPAGLRTSLRQWVDRYYRTASGYLHDARVNRLERVCGISIPRELHNFRDAMRQNDWLLLDAVDVALGKEPDYDLAEPVRMMFNEARSSYTVGTDENGNYELHLRQPAELTAIVEEAANESTSAAEHLRKAWSRAFIRREPDPAAAAFEAAMAIEAAAKPVVSPADDNATLGKMYRAMRDKPEKWATDADTDDDINTVAGLMQLVWESHERHGRDDQPAEVPLEQAQMLVQASALLVHWFQNGHIRTVHQP